MQELQRGGTRDREGVYIRVREDGMGEIQAQEGAKMVQDTATLS